MKKLNYNKISKNVLFENENLIWNSTLCTHIENEIHQGTYQVEYDDLTTLPRPIMHLHFLWRAQCELGASGFNYLFEAQAKEIIGIYNAFVEVEALELVKLMGEAISMANEYEQRIMEYHSETKGTEMENWFKQFTDQGKYDDLEDIELMKYAYKLSTGYLDEKILKYINQNLDVICV